MCLTANNSWFIQGRAKEGNFFLDKPNIKILVLEASQRDAYKAFINVPNYFVVYLPFSDRGIPFSRDLAFHFIAHLFLFCRVRCAIMADDDLGK